MFHDIGLGKNFWSKTSEAQTAKAKADQCDDISNEKASTLQRKQRVEG
jgi:hypothetical protein